MKLRESNLAPSLVVFPSMRWAVFEIAKKSRNPSRPKPLGARTGSMPNPKQQGLKHAGIAQRIVDLCNKIHGTQL